jgi:major vault protein
VEVLLSYRVNFEGDPERWFNVENYVKFLTDHMRSLLANAIKRHGVEEFYGNAIAIVRDTVLGPSAEGGRRGREFPENGMRIYDVEVLEVKIGDEEIESLLVEAQHEVVNQTLHVQAERRRLDLVEQTEAVKREVQHTESKTRQLSLDLQAEEARKRMSVELAEVEAKAEVSRHGLAAREAEQAALGNLHQAELARRRASVELEQAVTQRALEQRLAELKAEVDAVSTKARAVSPDLVAALQAFSDRALVERVSESMAPLAILGGRSVTDVLAQLLKGTALERALGNGGNGGHVTTGGREAAITG